MVVHAGCRSSADDPELTKTGCALDCSRRPHRADSRRIPLYQSTEARYRRLLLARPAPADLSGRSLPVHY